MRLLTAITIALLLSLSLGGCGAKGDLEPPPKKEAS